MKTMEPATRDQKHFLVVTFPAQGHINPAIHLAKRMAEIEGARITFSTAVSGHRKMFPDLASPDEETHDGAIAYLPFSDGYDEGFRKGIDDEDEYRSTVKTTSATNLSAVIRRLNSRGTTVDCVVYTFLVSWAADVAQAHGILSAQYWIQPATVFAIYYHSFHGYAEPIADMATVELPGLPPLRARDLPSFLLSSSDHSDHSNPRILAMIKEAFVQLDHKEQAKPKVLVNSFEELERDAFSSLSDSVELIAVGPILQSLVPMGKAAAAGSFSLFKADSKAYMEWLDSKAEGSVVYVSFGSLAVMNKRQMEEMWKGLKASGRPYLWVVRRDCRQEAEFDYEDEGNGMIVEWCSQTQVLSHPAVGCFVTHCGWNSTLESLVCGVPTVGVPQWSDQGTNAMLMEKAWGMGVRGEVDKDGVLECEELKRCLDLVFQQGEHGVEMRGKAQMWKEKATRAVEGGGSSDRNLKAFVQGLPFFDNQNI